MDTAFFNLFNALPKSAKEAMLPTLQLFNSTLEHYKAFTRPSACATRRRAFREQLVERIWEPDLRRDLVEYILFALDNRWTDENTLNDIIDAARKDNESGKVDRMWRVIGSWLRGVIEGAGQPWYPTKGAPEPRPAKLQEETNKKKREARAVKRLEKELALD